MIQLGLIGYPLGHSLSPKIHKTALEACQLEGDYALFPIAPEDQDGLKALLDRVRHGEITGLNVTIPHKQTVIPYLDELTSTAKAIGAVNTISMRGGKLTGDNTDAPGFLADVQRLLTLGTNKYVIPGSALVLGAGGSARAVVYALVNAGWKVSVAARRLEQAEALIKQFQGFSSKISGIGYEIAKLRTLISNVTLIVNTTPLGMSPNLDVSPWPDGLPFPSCAAVYDLVYNPRETKLVKDARSAGLSAAAGLGMLVEQAALSFEIWTGHAPSRALLSAVIR